MARQLEPLAPLPLDPRNERELVAYALNRVYMVSGGKLNDFSASSPICALIEGQAFAAAELLYCVNQLPEAMAIAFLGIAGIMRKLGTPAVATLTFTLSAPLVTPFTISAGYLVTTPDGKKFTTDTTLVIAAGAIEGNVGATSVEIGSAQNVGAYSLIQLSIPLAFLQSVTNREPATGGTDSETIPEVKNRGFAALRRRNLVSAEDYEAEARNVLGDGSVVKAIGNLDSDKLSFRLGCAHLFCLNSDGTLPNTQQLQNLQSYLLPKTLIGTELFCSPLDLVPIDVLVIAGMVPGGNPQVIANSVWAQLQAYFKPGSLPAGETVLVKEVEYQVRLVPSVDYIQVVFLEQDAINIPMPYPYSVPTIKSLDVQLGNPPQMYRYTYGDFS